MRRREWNRRCSVKSSEPEAQPESVDPDTQALSDRNWVGKAILEASSGKGNDRAREQGDRYHAIGLVPVSAERACVRRFQNKKENEAIRHRNCGIRPVEHRAVLSTQDPRTGWTLNLRAHADRCRKVLVVG
ncbi:hypothetical protein CIRG_00209 [Coccidioides immitis RMSCC 2394]|uniref:Uncharacterized protein n=1 Tax=Coccidioides immitis RMSCC 2394 TaxID=404692 RepID=A0A0J6XV90_COCIT|nr:hypothetical protein CIRG_00209 [Coccidioides immitis RMSCC 2394]